MVTNKILNLSWKPHRPYYLSAPKKYEKYERSTRSTTQEIALEMQNFVLSVQIFWFS